MNFHCIPQFTWMLLSWRFQSWPAVSVSSSLGPKRPVGYGSTLGNLPTGPDAPTSNNNNNNNNDDNNNKNNNKNKKGSTHSPMFTELVSLEISRICSKILAFFYKFGSFSHRIYSIVILYCFGEFLVVSACPFQRYFKLAYSTSPKSTCIWIGTATSDLNISTEMSVSENRLLSVHRIQPLFFIGLMWTVDTEWSRHFSLESFYIFNWIWLRFPYFLHFLHCKYTNPSALMVGCHLCQGTV